MELKNPINYLVYFTIYFNVFLASGDRICQIIYYGLTKFLTNSVNGTTLAFILIYPAANIIMIILYLLSQNDFNYTVGTKIKYFFYYLLSVESCYSLGAYTSLKNKYSDKADSVMIM